MFPGLPLAIKNLGIMSTFQSRPRPYTSSPLGGSFPKCLKTCIELNIEDEILKEKLLWVYWCTWQKLFCHTLILQP